MAVATSTATMLMTYLKLPLWDRSWGLPEPSGDCGQRWKKTWCPNCAVPSCCSTASSFEAIRWEFHRQESGVWSYWAIEGFDFSLCWYPVLCSQPYAPWGRFGAVAANPFLSFAFQAVTKHPGIQLPHKDNRGYMDMVEHQSLKMLFMNEVDNVVAFQPLLFFFLSWLKLWHQHINSQMDYLASVALMMLPLHVFRKVWN